MKLIAVEATLAILLAGMPGVVSGHRGPPVRDRIERPPHDHTRHGMFIGAFSGLGNRPGHHRDFGFSHR